MIGFHNIIPEDFKRVLNGQSITRHKNLTGRRLRNPGAFHALGIGQDLPPIDDGERLRVLREYVDEWLMTGLHRGIEDPNKRNFFLAQKARVAVLDTFANYLHLSPVKSGPEGLVTACSTAGLQRLRESRSSAEIAAMEAALLFTALLDSECSLKLAKCRGCGIYFLLTRNPKRVGYKHLLRCTPCANRASAERSKKGASSENRVRAKSSRKDSPAKALRLKRACEISNDLCKLGGNNHELVKFNAPEISKRINLIEARERKHNERLGKKGPQQRRDSTRPLLRQLCTRNWVTRNRVRIAHSWSRPNVSSNSNSRNAIPKGSLRAQA